MKATESKFLPFIRKSPRFVIPIYQRTYSWTEKECQQLWDDIMRAGSDPNISAHFIGSVVYVQDGLYNVSIQAPLLVIDGQQRLTSVTLLLAALAKHLTSLPAEDQEPADGFSPRKVRNYYLLNPDEDGEDRYRLTLAKVDRDTLRAIVTDNEQPKEHSARVMTNYEFFLRMLRGGVNLAHVCEGLAKLLIVDVSLDRTQDNPQLIFESMNSTGRELSQADLIRNYVLMRLEPDLQNYLYERYWLPMEGEFGQGSDTFDGFMRHYLTLKLADIPKINRLYEEFKAYARRTEVRDRGVEALVSDMRDHAQYYAAVALCQESDLRLRAVFEDLREMRIDVAYPLLMQLYRDYRRGLLNAGELETAARIIESYTFRRSIVGIPQNALNRAFQTVMKSVRHDRYLESFLATFVLFTTQRRFPSDAEFKADLTRRDLYNQSRRSYVLRKIENHGRKERIVVGELTIEHIMPQNPALSVAWRTDLGPDWERVHSTWLHTLGNLTLTGYNSEYADRPFAEKRDMVGGFAQSPLRLNDGLGTVTQWNETAILDRANKLAELAATIWPMPKIALSALDAYRPSAKIPSGYTYDDHKFLQIPEMQLLFDAFKREVLALDPMITEEILKYYITFRADTSVADVAVQKKWLRITINLAFDDLDDPRHIAKNVTEIGHHGKGDVQVHLGDPADIPYVIGLVRQSLERQMGVEEGGG